MGMAHKRKPLANSLYTHPQKNRGPSQASCFGHSKPLFTVLVPSIQLRGPHNNKRREHHPPRPPTEQIRCSPRPTKAWASTALISYLILPHDMLPAPTPLASLKPSANDLDPWQQYNRKCEYHSAGAGCQMGRAGRVDGYKNSNEPVGTHTTKIRNQSQK